MLQPKYTMHAFTWFDQRGVEGIGFVRAIRTLLTNHTPDILPDLGLSITENFVRLHSARPTVNGKASIIVSYQSSFTGTV